MHHFLLKKIVSYKSTDSFIIIYESKARLTLCEFPPAIHCDAILGKFIMISPRIASGDLLRSSSHTVRT